MSQSSELSAGAGFTYENTVSAYYLTHLLAENPITELADRVVSKVALQQVDFGEPLDDVIVDAKGNDGDTARLSLQVKKSLTISEAKTNEDFRRIVKDSWQTLRKDSFQIDTDRYGFVTYDCTTSKVRALKSLCDYARNSDTVEHFEQRFTDGGNASKEVKGIKDAIASIIIEECNVSITSTELKTFLAHFCAIKMDFLTENAASKTELSPLLKSCLTPEMQSNASNLFDAIQKIANEKGAVSASLNRSTLTQELKNSFSLVGAMCLQPDLEIINTVAETWIKSINNEIGGFQLKRPAFFQKIENALTSKRFVQISGLPGCGKSVVLRHLVENRLQQGPILFLKSDRITGKSWIEFAKSIDLNCTDIETLLSEIATTGSPLLAIDGIDRIASEQRAIVLDLIETIATSPALNDWRILVTSRTQGFEFVRNWLPQKLFNTFGVGVIDVIAFDDEEATTISEKLPSFRPLLFGSEEVRNIARRPFFAAILANQQFDAEDAKSETALIAKWWEHGGYDAELTQARKRQHALIDLASTYLKQLGKPISQFDLKDNTIEVADKLVEDAVIQDVEKGHTLEFSHDIFFEWALVNYLKSKGDCWIDEIRKAGEPPMLARCVELLSQFRYFANENWQVILEKLNSSNIRNQWLRAWLTAPFTSPSFPENSKLMNKTIIQGNNGLLNKLLVWFQADRTIPNQMVLSSDELSSRNTKYQLVRLADQLGWPNDFHSWKRLIEWLLDKIDQLPKQHVPEILTVFEVWQHLFNSYMNPASKALLSQSQKWLDEIEVLRHADNFTADKGPWEKLSYDELDELEKRLRSLILYSVQSNQEDVSKYLQKVIITPKIRRSAFNEINGFASYLSSTCPDELANIFRTEIFEELPDEKIKRKKEEQERRRLFMAELRAKPKDKLTRQEQAALSQPMLLSEFGSNGPDRYDWERLSIGHWNHGYFPPSPLREPFGSLFLNVPDVAIKLVRDMVNHATQSWRQLHDLDYERRASPIPITLTFPWGKQTFWGNTHEYMWGRGWWGPQAIECGFLALDKWSFEELNKGRNVNELIQKLLEGQTSTGILSIASALIAETKEISETTLPIILCQRLWNYEIQRIVNEGSNSRSALMGFQNGFQDQLHINALKKQNERASRQRELRDFIGICVLHKDKNISSSSQKIIQNFPNHLPFEYEEQRVNESVVSELLTRAENWAEWGKAENYKAYKNPENEDQVLIGLDNPKLKEPEAIEFQQKHSQMLSEITLWNWVDDTFEHDKISERLKLHDALNYAKQIDNPTVFQNRSPDGQSDIKLGALAGTAAIIIKEQKNLSPDDILWAKDVLERALSTPENTDIWLSKSVLSWHPLKYVAYACKFEIQNDAQNNHFKEVLLNLACHPLENICKEAFKNSIECWDIDPHFTWCAIELGMRLSIGSKDLNHIGSRVHNPEYGQDYIRECFDAIWKLYQGTQHPFNLTPPPPAWDFSPHISEDLEFEDQFLSNDPVWREGDIYWRWDFAPIILNAIPIGKIMQSDEYRPPFINFFDQLLNWTIDRIQPPWREKNAQQDSHGTDLIEWNGHLARRLAIISSYLSPNEIQTRYLQRFFSLDDEKCVSLLSTFVDFYIAHNIIDRTTIHNDANAILSLCLDKMLSHKDLKKTGYRDGRIHGYDLPELIRSFFFIHIEYAGGAARFANRDWREIQYFIPTFTKIMSSIGWIPHVAGCYLTLCERSQEHFPAESFADHILSIFENNELPLPEWRNTTLPARIAGLIQSYADQQKELDNALAQKFLKILDFLIDTGDRRSAALQMSETFFGVKVN